MLLHTLQLTGGRQQHAPVAQLTALRLQLMSLLRLLPARTPGVSLLACMHKTQNSSQLLTAVTSSCADTGTDLLLRRWSLRWCGC